MRTTSRDIHGVVRSHVVDGVYLHPCPRGCMEHDSIELAMHWLAIVQAVLVMVAPTVVAVLLVAGR